MNGFSEKVSFIWSVADLLRGDYKQSEYGRVILPFTVLRRLDCVLEPTKEEVLETAAKYEDSPEGIRNRMVQKAAGTSFYNISKLDFGRLLDDPENIAGNLRSYIHSFSPNARDILEHFRFQTQIDRLERADLLYLIVQKFNSIDLHPDVVPNMQMGYIFEELIRKFSEQSNETAGEHFTPREVIRLMVNLLFDPDDATLSKRGIVKTLYDPACGTGGMLSVPEQYLHELNPDARVKLFGQELNGESYAICKADMMIKGEEADNIKYGNSFSEDGLPDHDFDYMLSNPPFGVDWKKVKKVVEQEHETMGFAGRFGAGTPSIDDGSLLFLQHMISKMKPVDDGGSRLAIVFNASPLFTSSPNKNDDNECAIRKWIIENDWLEAIIALPDQLFYNTGINTYIWVLTNQKAPERKGKIQLINAVGFYQKMRKSLGKKRHELSDDHIDEISRIYGAFEEGEHSKIFDNEDFGYYRVKVERPLRQNFQTSEERIAQLKEERKFQNRDEEQQERILTMLREMPDKTYRDVEEFRAAFKSLWNEIYDETLYAGERDVIVDALGERDEEAEPVVDRQGRPETDSDLRDYENIPLEEDIEEYFEREVKPYVPDAWIDEDYTRIGYEIPFTRHFYEYEPPRPLEEIEAEILALEDEIQGMLREVVS